MALLEWAAKHPTKWHPIGKLEADKRAAELLATCGVIEVWRETQLYRLTPKMWLGSFVFTPEDRPDAVVQCSPPGSGYSPTHIASTRVAAELRYFGEVPTDLWDGAAIPCECGYL